MTKDERFLLELYRAVQAAHNPEATLNPQQIAKKLGFKEHLTKEILKGLRQANLIKIYSSDEIILTSRGLDVAQALLS